MDCVGAAGRMDADCCWWSFLLVAAANCCCWLLLMVAFAGCCCWLLLLIAAADCRCWLLLLIAAAGGRKVFEYFRDIDDLRLRQFCRRKSLWIFSGCWWKVFEFFQNIDERKVEESFASGKLVVDSSKRMNIMAVHWVFILDIFKMAAVWARANRIIWWEMESGRVGSVSGRICRQDKLEFLS